MGFGKMAALLFGLAGVLALVSFTVLPAVPSSVPSGGEGHVVTSHAEQGEDPAENANRGLAEARARRAALPVDLGAPPGAAGGLGDPGAASPTDTTMADELPAAGQDRVPQPAAAPIQSAPARAPQVQAAPQVSFVPGQPMVDTNPSR